MMMDLIKNKIRREKPFHKTTVPVDLIMRKSTLGDQKTLSIKKVQRSDFKILPVNNMKLNVKVK
jgi:hypothetical protein